MLIANLLLVAACSNTSSVIEIPEESVSHSSTDYMIGVSDELTISVWKHPDLSVQIPVRPDGKISVPLLGDIMAAEKTPMGLSEDIESHLKSYIRTPEVTVLVTSTSSTDFMHRIRITGAVENPSSIPFRKGMTVIDAILLAGGTNDFAAANKSKLYRKYQGKTKAFPIYLNDILNKGILDTNYSLSPSDVITVPERSF